MFTFNEHRMDIKKYKLIRNVATEDFVWSDTERSEANSK